MEQSKLNILVIEDNEKHLEDAERFFVIHCGRVNVIFAKTYWEAAEYLDAAKVDGIISDIHFPRNDHPNWSQPEPIGAMVMVLCRERKIPCILNTDGYHHGSRNQWICDLQRSLGLPEIVDASTDYRKEAETKNWKKAYEKLLEEISKKS